MHSSSSSVIFSRILHAPGPCRFSQSLHSRRRWRISTSITRLPITCFGHTVHTHALLQRNPHDTVHSFDKQTIRVKRKPTEYLQRQTETRSDSLIWCCVRLCAVSAIEYGRSNAHLYMNTTIRYGNLYSLISDPGNVCANMVALGF